MITYKNVWYFWHTDYPEYTARMRAMADMVKSELHKYFVDKLTLVPKD